MEKQERNERSEKEMKTRRKTGPKPGDSGFYDQHFSMRMGIAHLDIIDRVGAKGGESRGEVIRTMIKMFGKKMKAAGKI